MLPPPLAPGRDLGSHAVPASAEQSQALINIESGPPLVRTITSNMFPAQDSAQASSTFWDGGPIITDAGPPPSQPHHHHYETHRLVLEEVLPRETAVYIISLYFDYVSCHRQCRSTEI